MKLTLFAVLTGAAIATATAAAAQPYNLTIAGYSPGGLVSTTAAGLDAALSAAYPGSTVTYQTSSGGLANALLVDQKKVPLGMASDHELAVAVKGQPPFTKPVASLRVLLGPYSASSRFQASHVLVNKDWADRYGIKTLADVAAKKPPMKVAVNRPGNLDGDVALAILAAAGITQDNVKAWGGQIVRAASQEQTSLMLDRRIDAVVVGISIKHPRVTEMANGLQLVMLPIADSVAQKVVNDMGGGTCTIKAGEYDFLATDTASVCVGLNVIAHADMDEKLAYNFTKGIVENIEKYKAAHRLLKAAVTVESMTAPGPAPFHPGAAKYYREKGLLK